MASLKGFLKLQLYQLKFFKCLYQDRMASVLESFHKQEREDAWRFTLRQQFHYEEIKADGSKPYTVRKRH